MAFYVLQYIPEYKCISYSQDKLIEVKEEWSRYVLENVIGEFHGEDFAST